DSGHNALRRRLEAGAVSALESFRLPEAELPPGAETPARRSPAAALHVVGPPTAALQIVGAPTAALEIEVSPRASRPRPVPTADRPANVTGAEHVSPLVHCPVERLAVVRPVEARPHEPKRRVLDEAAGRAVRVLLVVAGIRIDVWRRDVRHRVAGPR